MEKDISERDRYARLLRYLSVGNLFKKIGLWIPVQPQSLQPLPVFPASFTVSSCAQADCDCGDFSTRHRLDGDNDGYVMFSYSRNICSCNHRRFTLCGYHYTEDHKGSWKICKKCREDFEHELEMYVWYGTNKYSFEKLFNPPAFEPTCCFKCDTRIVLPDGGYSKLCGVYRCDNCLITAKEREEIIREYKEQPIKKSQ